MSAKLKLAADNNDSPPMLSTPRPLLDKVDVAKWLNVSTRQINRLRKQEDFPRGLLVGRTLRWKPEAIEAYLTRLENSA